ncbi:unnamed protein product [Protopolystoma xenopodis]|uniref:Uncharacterized protein n=1 Tax=Protopolystoma xenopodis TaxID=117903 RepID=A0A3S5CJL2_9PLAT|nr:unnamed protein product [Protopolystoma xenopodis]
MLTLFPSSSGEYLLGDLAFLEHQLLFNLWQHWTVSPIITIPASSSSLNTSQQHVESCFETPSSSITSTSSAHHSAPDPSHVPHSHSSAESVKPFVYPVQLSDLVRGPALEAVGWPQIDEVSFNHFSTIRQ